MRTDVVPRDFLRFVLLAAGAGALLLLASTADHGGRLVYQHAVAVTPQPAPVPAPSVAPPTAAPGAGGP
jgi:hypothetical protein